MTERIEKMPKSSNGKIAKNHFSLTSNTDISQICQPLFQKFDFNIMNFIRLYDDGTVVYLCDNRDWLEHYLQNNYPSLGAFEQNSFSINDKNDYVLWSSLSNDDPVVIDSRTIFNIRYGVTLIFQFSGGCDFFNFGTSENERSVMGKIYNQLEELQQFSKIFYEKSKRVLNTANHHRFDLAQFKTNEKIITPITRFYLGANYNYAYLTEKEISCLKSLITGKTIPEISTLLQISSRTIEKHIENIKSKLRCKTQFELGYLAAKLGITT